MKNKLKQKNIQYGWEKVKLNDIASVSSGGTPSRKNLSYWNGGIPWVTTSEINFNIILQTHQFISGKGLVNSSAKIFSLGTLLMAMYGQGKTRGKVARLGIKAATNQACAAIKIKEQNSADFYFYYLSSQYKNIRKISNAGGQKKLSIALIKKIALLHPPLPEQKRIVAVLEVWDEYLEKLDRKIEVKKNIKKGLMQQLLTGKKRLKGFDGKWQTVKLENITICLDNKRVPLNEDERSTRKGNIPYCGANGILDFIDEYIFNEDIIWLF